MIKIRWTALAGKIDSDVLEKLFGGKAEEEYFQIEFRLYDKKEKEKGFADFAVTKSGSISYWAQYDREVRLKLVKEFEENLYKLYCHIHGANPRPMPERYGMGIDSTGNEDIEDKDPIRFETMQKYIVDNGIKFFRHGEEFKWNEIPMITWGEPTQTESKTPQGPRNP